MKGEGAMTFLGAAGLLVIFLFYRDNREQINEQIKSLFRRRENKKVISNVTYYAGNDHEKQFDNDICSAIEQNGDKAQMALYAQQQEILNQVRMLRDNHKEDTACDCFHVTGGYMKHIKDDTYMFIPN